MAGSALTATKMRYAGRVLLAVALLAVGVWIVGEAAGADGTPAFDRWVGWSNVLALLVGSIGPVLVLVDRSR